MNRPNSTFAHTNRFAMQNGLYLGGWAILCLLLSGLSFTYPILNLPAFILSTAGSVFFATTLTHRFRKATTPLTETFTFARGFTHSLLMGLYAALWVTVFVYIYLRFLDHGAVFDAYLRQLQAPEMQKSLRESGMEVALRSYGGVKGFVNQLRDISPADYAMGFFNLSIMANPLISLIIGLICRKKALPPHFSERAA